MAGGFVRIQVLGPVRLWRGADEVAVGTPRARAVLGLLALACGQPLTRSELIEALWGQRPPATAANVIQTYVAHLRRLLEPRRRPRTHSDVLLTVGDGYALRSPAIDVDLVNFRRLVTAATGAQQQDDLPDAARLLGEAVSMWHGPALSDVSFLAAHPAVAALARERQRVVARYGDLMIAIGDAEEVLPLLAATASADPLDEKAQARLIRAYQATGRLGDAFATYTESRARLIDDLGVDPGPALTEAYAALLHHGTVAPPGADRAAAPARPAPEPAAARRPVPAQLPGDVAGFTGRGLELAELSRILDPGRPGSGGTDAAGRDQTAAVISAVSGTAGVGKTALAVRWAHQARASFPDGQLYVSLHGADLEQPVTTAAALTGILTALGVPHQDLPAEVTDLAARYRSEIAGRRMLVVLDNAGSVEQVRPLLPGTASCVVLVTSRYSLSGLVALHGAHRIDLDLLPLADAVALLRRLIGARVDADPAAAAALAEQCARLPLALRLAAELAASRPSGPLTDLVGELADEQHRLDLLDAGGDPRAAVRVVFSSSYRHLTPEAARLFRLLGLQPGPDISAAAAASLAGRAWPETRRLLAELTRASLLTEYRPGRYLLHDLLRAYATELAHRHDTEPVRRAAIGRVLDHYLHTAHAADQILDPTHPPVIPAAPAADVSPERLLGHRAAMDWLAAERPALLAAQRSAASAGFDTHTWQLAWAVETFLDRRGHWSDLVTTWQAAEQAAERLGDPAWRAHALRRLAIAHALFDRYPEADANLGLARELYERTGDQVGRAHIHRHLAYLADRRNRPQVALDEAEQALRLYRASNHRIGQSQILNSIGWYHALLGNYPQALASCQQALTLHQQLADRWGEANVWDSLGYVHHHLARPDEAADCYQRALALFRALGERYYEADTLVHLGDAQSGAGDPAGAAASWRHAVDILVELGLPTADLEDRISGLPEV